MSPDTRFPCSEAPENPDAATLSDSEFTELVRSLSDELVVSLGSRYGWDIAEDAAAEAFAVAWRRRAELPHDLAARRAWIRECGRRTAMDMQRRLIRRRAADHEVATDRAIREPADPSEALAAADSVEWLLSQLSTSEADAARLVAVEGLRGPEAAALLGISPAALRKRVSRAASLLRTVVQLGQSENEGGKR